MLCIIVIIVIIIIIIIIIMCEIGFSVSHLTPLLHRIEATDGRSALTAVVSRDQGLIACRVHDSMENVEKVLRYHNLTIQTIGPGSSLAIVPGTKWCGKGNVAKTFDDLGE
nr:hypothetical protein BaRGS_019626 [Batillaria attramentaria]